MGRNKIAKRAKLSAKGDVRSQVREVQSQVGLITNPGLLDAKPAAGVSSTPLKMKRKSDDEHDDDVDYEATGTVHGSYSPIKQADKWEEAMFDQWKKDVETENSLSSFEVSNKEKS